MPATGLSSGDAHNEGASNEEGGPPVMVGHRSRILVYSAGPVLERSRPLLRRLEDANLDVMLRTDQDLVEENLAEVPECTALLVLWSQFFHGAVYEGRLKEISSKASAAGAAVLNDVPQLILMQDRRWLLRQLREHGVPTPEFVECSRDGGEHPSLEEHDDYIVVSGQRINKPFVEKPVDRRDRTIYVYFPKVAGGGRALMATTESGDTEYICRFDTPGTVRREGSFIYQEYLQSEGFIVQAVCVGEFVFGNAVLSGIVGQPKPGASNPASPTASGMWGSRNGGQACAVWLQQEEKTLALKLKEVFHQTLFGITFARSQTTHRSATSYVTDVWPGIPRCGLGSHRDDAVRALLLDLERRLPQGQRIGAILSQTDSPTIGPCMQGPAAFPGTLQGVRGASNPLASQYMPHNASSISLLDLDAGCTDPDSDLLCVLLVARHGDRTPKQKVKVKVKLASEFAAGWLCGCLVADTDHGMPMTSGPTTFELRKPEQLPRLANMLKQLKAGGYEVGTLIDALDCIVKEGMVCHAKIGVDGATVAVALKWGGELTSVGVDEAEALGWCFRGKTFPGEDIDELHATLRHDVKIYASKESRCQQTAAAFCKGLLHLDSPLPPIIAALVRTDEFGQEGDDGKGKDNYVEKEDALLPAETPWLELEALTGPCVPTCLQEFGAPGPALRMLMVHLEELQEAVQLGQCSGPLHKGETHALLLERYRELLAELGPKDAPRFHKAPDVLDHVQYDSRHNRKVLPPPALRALDQALLLSEALCDVVAPLEAALERQDERGGRGRAGRSVLHKLRWDLRVASGADLGEESQQHMAKHAALYALAADGAVRTRLYFGHNSWLKGLLGVIFGGSLSSCPSTAVGEACSQLVAARLGFLAHLAVRLRRHRSSGDLLVSCDFAVNGEEEPKQLFELPLATVDAWWSEALR